MSVLQSGNVLAFIAVVTVNSLAGATRLLNGRNTADVSAAYPTLVTPAGFTFSIWGVIYALTFAFILYQALPKHRQDSFNGKVGYLFILSSVLNIAWLFLWQYGHIVASVPVIFGLLASLIAIYLRLDVGKSKAPLKEKLIVHLPFSVYLGWITVASIADTASAVVSVGWDGWGVAPSVWAQFVLVVAVVITLTVLITRRDVAYGLVIVWALSGIAANQASHPPVVATIEYSIVVIVVALAVVVLATLVLSQSKNGARPSGSSP